MNKYYSRNEIETQIKYITYLEYIIEYICIYYTAFLLCIHQLNLLLFVYFIYMQIHIK